MGIRSSRRYKQLAHMVMHMKPSVLLRLSSWSRSLRCSLAGLLSSCTQAAAWHWSCALHCPSRRTCMRRNSNSFL